MDTFYKMVTGASAAIGLTREAYKVAKPIIDFMETKTFKAIFYALFLGYGIINAPLETIADYFRNKRPEAYHLKINKIKHNLESGNYNEIDVGIHGNNSYLNESITCESIDSSIKEGQIIYI